jgi:hypothetical protein
MQQFTAVNKLLSLSGDVREPMCAGFQVAPDRPVRCGICLRNNPRQLDQRTAIQRHNHGRSLGGLTNVGSPLTRYPYSISKQIVPIGGSLDYKKANYF